MRKRSAYVLSFVMALMMVACSENDVNILTGETAELRLQLSFEGTTNPNSRAAETTAIPLTSWDNIRQVQFFLYDATGKIVYSKVETPTPNKPYVYTDVPTGDSYTLVAVANAKSTSDAVTTYISNVAVEWDMHFVRQKQIGDLFIKHKVGEFPQYNKPTGNVAITEPAEIFLAYQTNIKISSTQKETASLQLTREVSLFRARLNVEEARDESTGQTYDMKNTVDFTKNASILIYRLPEYIGISEGNGGGVSTSSDEKQVIAVWNTDGSVFKTADPTDGYKENGKIINAEEKFTMWRDIVVFPNNGGRVKGNNVTEDATDDQQYTIVISAQGEAGHVLADGTILSEPTTVYWSGLVKSVFTPNVIRDVNITLRSGGSATIPTEPVTQGDLEITVGAPADWSSVVVNTNVEL